MQAEYDAARDTAESMARAQLNGNRLDWEASYFSYVRGGGPQREILLALAFSAMLADAAERIVA
ncbi:MAG: hypothetical protein ACJ752_14065 [Gaiellaceae bacterium]